MSSTPISISIVWDTVFGMFQYSHIFETFNKDNRQRLCCWCRFIPQLCCQRLLSFTRNAPSISGTRHKVPGTRGQWQSYIVMMLWVCILWPQTPNFPCLAQAHGGLFCMTPKHLHHGAQGNVSVSALLVPRQNSCYISSALDDSVINHLLLTSAPFLVHSFMIYMAS